MQMLFNSHPFAPQNVSEAYKISGHYQKWLNRWNAACNSIKKFTVSWQLHFEGKKKMAAEDLILTESKLNTLFVERDTCEVKIREEQPAD